MTRGELEMTELRGKVESLLKDRTGVKLNGKWYKGESKLNLNKDDEITLSLDPTNLDSYGNPTISSIEKHSSAPNPFKGGGNKGTFQPRPQDPDTQTRIARSHAITTAVAILQGQGADLTLSKATALAEKIRVYTETGQLPTETAKAAGPAKKPKVESSDFSLDD